jgi:hypothetical protein
MQQFVKEVITPERAAAWLRNNPANRRIRPRHVRMLCASMRAGEWKETHQAIGIDSDGIVVDGQHRLAAIVMFGQPVQMWVAYGVGKDTFGAVDTGLARDVADHFTGKKEVPQVAAFLARLVHGTTCTIKQIAQVHEVTGGLSERLIETHGQKRKGVTSAPVRAAAALQVLRGHDELYVVNLYGMLSRFDTANPDLPPIGHAFLRQAASGHSHTNRSGVSQPYDSFVRALQVFDKSKAASQRLILKDPEPHLADARRDVLSLLGVNSNTEAAGE